MLVLFHSFWNKKQIMYDNCENREKSSFIGGYLKNKKKIIKSY